MRNRITIDTDIVYHGNNNNNSNDSEPGHHPSYAASYSPLSKRALPPSHRPQGEDTDRWVEEQFDLGCYEDNGEGIDVGQVKETDILSDDDEYCKSVRAAAAAAEASDLEGKMEGLHLQGAEMKSHNLGARVTQDQKASKVKRCDDSRSVDSFASAGVSVSRCVTPAVKLAPLKQCAVEGVTNKDHEVIWVRRDDFANGYKSDVF